jgi:rRNA maturation endonuclease Nob1
MDNLEQSHYMELIQQAKEIGLLDSNLTMKCVHCKAIFPKEYNKCPQCSTNQI